MFNSRNYQRICRRKEFEKPVLTGSVVFFLETFGKGIISNDFVGVVVNLKPKFDALLLINLGGGEETSQS